MHLPRHKAPGEGGVVAEWMKVLLPPRLARVGPGVLEHADWEEKWGDGGPSPVARVVLGILNKVWSEQYIPQCWRVAELVSIAGRVQDEGGVHGAGGGLDGGAHEAMQEGESEQRGWPENLRHVRGPVQGLRHGTTRGSDGQAASAGGEGPDAGIHQGVV